MKINRQVFYKAVLGEIVNDPNFAHSVFVGHTEAQINQAVDMILAARTKVVTQMTEGEGVKKL